MPKQTRCPLNPNHIMRRINVRHPVTGRHRGIGYYCEECPIIIFGKYYWKPLGFSDEHYKPLIKSKDEKTGKIIYRTPEEKDNET